VRGNFKSYEVRLEKDLHNLIQNELTRRGIFAIHSRTDRKTTQQVGVPDFIFCFPGVPIAVECKLPGAKLTDDQAYVAAKMQKNGWLYFVVTSYEEFREILDTWS